MRKYISIFVLITLFLTGCASSRGEITAESSVPTENPDGKTNMTVFEKIFLPMASGGSRTSMDDFTAVLNREGIAWSEEEGIVCTAFAEIEAALCSDLTCLAPPYRKGDFLSRKPPNIFIIAQKKRNCLFSFYPIFISFSYGTSHLEKLAN